MEGRFNIFGWLLSVLAAAGNGFVVFLIVKNRRLHCPANWFVLSLAVADFGVGIVVFPVSYLCNLNSKPCNMRVHIAFYWLVVHSSVTNLCSLAWDRYTAIVHPFRYITSMTVRRPRIVILVAWLIPLGISLAMVLGMYITNSQTAWKVLRLTGVSAFDILSCALLFYVVVRILVVTRAQSLQNAAIEAVKRNLKPIEQQSQQDRTSLETALPCRRQKHNAARFIIALLTFFLGCYVVINYLVIHITVFEPEEVTNKAGWILTVLLITNSAVNPLVYAFLKRDIRKEITRLICRETRQNDNRKRSSRSAQADHTLL